MSKFETMGKSRVSEDDLVYLVSTTEVEAYLQDRINRICNTIKANGGETLNVKVNLTSEHQFGKRFLPFIVALPACVEDVATSNSHIPEALRPDNDDSGVRLKKPFYQLFANYTYNNDDRKALNAPAIRKDLGLNRGSVPILQSLIKPKKETYGDQTIIMFILDPIRVFTDYLRDRNNPNDRFTPEIVGMNKINDDGVYEYHVRKKYDKRKANMNNKAFRQRMFRVLQSKR